MSFFYNLKIIHKMIILIILMTIFIFIIGLVGYFFFDKNSTLSIERTNQNLLFLEAFTDARNQNRAMEALIYKMATSDDAENLKKDLKHFNWRKNKLEEIFSDFDQRNLNNEATQLMKRLRSSQEEIWIIYNKTLKLIQQGENQKAVEYFYSKSDRFEEFADNIRNVAQFNLREASRIKSANIERLFLGEVLIVINLIFAVFFSILLGIFITNLIVRPLSRIVEKIKQVASGDLEVEKNDRNSTDEIGMLNSAINQMADNLKTIISREQILRTIILASIKSLNKEDVVQSFVTETGKFFNAKICRFIEYDSQIDEYKKSEPYHVYPQKLRIPILSKKIIGEFHDLLINKKEIVVVKSIKESIKSSTKYTYTQELKKTFEDFRVKSFMAAPVFYSDKTFGLFVASFEEELLGDVSQEVDLFTTIAGQFANIMNQSYLYEKIKSAKDRETNLRQFFNEVVASEDLESAVKVIINNLGHYFNVDVCEFRFFDYSYRRFIDIGGIYSKTNEVSQFLEFSNSIKECIVRKIFDNKEIFFIKSSNKDNYSDEFNNDLKMNNIYSSVMVPLFYKNIPLACISFLNTKEEKKWTDEEVDFLNIVIPQISSYISMFYLNQKLKKTTIKERSLREIVVKVNELQEHSKVYEYLGIRLCEIFNTDAYLHIHLDTDNNFKIVNSIFNDGKERSEIASLFSSCRDWLDKQNWQEPIVINNVQTEIFDEGFKQKLLENDIQSFIINFAASEMQAASKDLNVDTSINVLLINRPQNWSSDEVSAFAFIVDAVTIIYLDIERRKILEETRRNFISTLTHDLRSPMLAEQRALEMMLKSDDDRTMGEYKEYLQDMYDTNEDLLKMINNLLSVYQYDANRVELNFQMVNIQEVIQSSVRALKHLAFSKSSNIIENINDDLLLVNIDESEIKRVLINLISNAIKHSKGGTEITVSSAVKDNNVIISVSDNGPGIDPADRDKIFQKYQTSKRKVGSGLGLYLSKQIVTAHNGKIWFETEVNKGTTFYFTIPIAK